MTGGRFLTAGRREREGSGSEKGAASPSGRRVCSAAGDVVPDAAVPTLTSGDSILRGGGPAYDGWFEEAMGERSRDGRDELGVR